MQKYKEKKYPVQVAVSKKEDKGDNSCRCCNVFLTRKIKIQPMEQK